MKEMQYYHLYQLKLVGLLPQCFSGKSGGRNPTAAAHKKAHPTLSLRLCNKVLFIHAGPQIGPFFNQFALLGSKSSVVKIYHALVNVSWEIALLIDISGVGTF